ncbi:MAG: Non-classical phosphatidylinositol transfer protein (PITP) [Vezdaea aestivalis]|nr:MAG: Non-classical phosphatidylinositol transfer protein (PITP) [Vezdaea aestivalis]
MVETGDTTATAQHIEAPNAAVEPTSAPVEATVTPLKLFEAKLSAILNSANHDEIWGVRLSAADPIPVPTKVILQKFLRANQNDTEKAAEQLSKTLKWRKEFRAADAINDTFERSKFDGLGYITKSSHADGDDTNLGIITWNIYGAVTNFKHTFGDVDEFLRWRVGLMEKALTHLSLETATQEIPEGGPDPYQIAQIHDYLSVAFLRTDPAVKTASRAAIALFQDHYPELLSRKFFVNVPLLASWMFGAMKVFMAAETKRKLIILSYGNQLATYLGNEVPRDYGGVGEELNVAGETLTLA